MKRKILLLLIGIICIWALLSACGGKKKAPTFLPESLLDGNVEVVDVKIDEPLYEHLDQWLETDRYVKLDNEPLVADIKKIHIEAERIYIHDDLSRILCYDMQGHFLWKIDARGAGPGEYVDITHFLINAADKEVVIYDNLGQSLLWYNIRNGRFIRKEKLTCPNPTDMAFKNGMYLYDHRYHNNYPDKDSLFYSLLISDDGLRITQRYFPHEEGEASISWMAPEKFYYSDSLLLYYRDFSNEVHEISSKGIGLRYRINLPEPYPRSYIEDGKFEVEQMKQPYSYWLCDIYTCQDLLYFSYCHGLDFMVSLYDCKKHQLIFSGRRMQGSPDSQLPLFLLIDGVYQGEFFGVLTPMFIGDLAKKKGTTWPAVLDNYDPDNDNPVIAFYRVKREAKL